MNKQEAWAVIDANRDTFIEVNDRVWDYAETAFAEYQSMDLICEKLAENGFEVEKGVGRVPTAFVGRYGRGKPVIGILAEYDALSGLAQEAGVAERRPIPGNGNGQGCGHNCLGAGSLAAAVGVKAYLEATGREGTVVYFGCPGEEGGSGKTFMAREGVFDGVDAVVTWHPNTFNGVMTGSFLANYQVLYKFKGIASHAAGDPHLGRSALDAVELMNVGVQYLREHMIDAARIHYAITDTGGYSPNVVQPTASVLYLIRSPITSQVQELYERVNDIARGAAMMTDTTLEIEFIKACSNVIVNGALERVLHDNMEAIGVPSYTAEEEKFAAEIIKSYENPSFDPPGVAAKEVPEIAEMFLKANEAGKVFYDFLTPFYTTDTVSAGSTDVGDVSWVAPTAQVWAVTTPIGSPGHSWQNVASNKTSIAHKGVLFAGKTMAGAIIDLMEKPELLDAAKAEHLKKLDGREYVCPIPKAVMPKAIGLNM